MLGLIGSITISNRFSSVMGYRPCSVSQEATGWEDGGRGQLNAPFFVEAVSSEIVHLRMSVSLQSCFVYCCGALVERCKHLHKYIGFLSFQCQCRAVGCPHVYMPALPQPAACMKTCNTAHLENPKLPLNHRPHPALINIFASCTINL